MNLLLEALNLTQHASSHNFQKAEEILSKARQEKNYFSCLLHLIEQDSTSPNIKLASACCLAKDIKIFFSSINISSSGDLINEVLGYFKQNIFSVISNNVQNLPICNKLEESLKTVTEKIYPLHWPQLGEFLLPTLKDSNNFGKIYSTLKGVFFMLRKYKNCIGDKREPLKFLSRQTLPYVENLAMKLLNQVQSTPGKISQMQEIIMRILNIILKCFKVVNYLKIETGRLIRLFHQGEQQNLAFMFCAKFSNGKYFFVSTFNELHMGSNFEKRRTSHHKTHGQFSQLSGHSHATIQTQI